MDLPAPRPPRHVSVKEAVLPFQRFPRADALLGPEMKSTGEVMGVAADYPAAFGKAQAAAGSELPKAGTVFISVTDGDKPAATQLAAGSATWASASLPPGGTATAIRRMGVPVERIMKVFEGSPNVVDRIEAREVDLVINTRPAPARGPTVTRSGAPPSGAGSPASPRCRAPAPPSGPSAPAAPSRPR